MMADEANLDEPNFNLVLNMNNSQSSSLDENDLAEMEHASRPLSTTRATQSGMKKNQNWLEKRGKTVDFHSVTPDDLINM